MRCLRCLFKVTVSENVFFFVDGIPDKVKKNPFDTVNLGEMGLFLHGVDYFGEVGKGEGLASYVLSEAA